MVLLHKGQNVGDQGQNVGDQGQNVGLLGQNVGDQGQNVGDKGQNVGVSEDSNKHFVTNRFNKSNHQKICKAKTIKCC